MVDLLFGRSFWQMVLRFALLPIVACSIGVVVLLLFDLKADRTILQLSLAQLVAIAPYIIAIPTWFGWGLAFWRFDRSKIPVRSFAAYPLLTGLTAVPAMWVLVSISGDQSQSSYIAVTIFGIVAGPLQALLAATLSRTLPQSTALRKSQS